MSGGNRGRNSKALDWAFPVIGIVLALAIALGLGWLQGREAERRYQSPHRHAESAKSNAQRACAGIEPSAVFECIYDKVETSEETARTEQDLSAQQRAASAALAGAVVAFITLLVSVIGVWFVKRTLDATLEAVEDTGRATEAMQRQNDIAEAAQRAWIEINPRISKFRVKRRTLLISYEMEFKNIGQSIAKNVHYFGRFSPEDLSFSGSVNSHRRRWAEKRGFSEIALMPGEAMTLAGDSMLAIDHLPWTSDEGSLRCSFVFNAAVFYNTHLRPNRDDRREAYRTFRVGIKGEHKVFEIIVFADDLKTAGEKEVVITATSPSKTT